MLYTNNTINNTVKTSNTSMTSETSAPFLMTAEAGETPNPPAGAGVSEGIPAFCQRVSKEYLAKVIGYIVYLTSSGKEYSCVPYAREGDFAAEIEDCLDHGVPISVCVFTDEAGKPMISTRFIGEQGCLPCGYRTEPHPLCIPTKAETATTKAKTLFWKIPVSWSMMATIEVEAVTLAEAIEIAQDKDDEIPLPDGTYMGESWEVDCDDEEYLRAWYNDNQEDLDLSETEDCETTAITEEDARADIIEHLSGLEESWFEETCHRYKAEILANNALIEALAAEHLRCVNRFGNDHDWSAQDACNGIEDALQELFKPSDTTKGA